MSNITEEFFYGSDIFFPEQKKTGYIRDAVRMKISKIEQWDDFKLVDFFKQGYEECFDEIIRRYYQSLAETANKLTDFPEDAQEIVNNTFLLAYRHLHTFRGDSRLSTWLQSILRNQAVNCYRARCRNGSNITQSLEVQDESNHCWYTVDLPDWENLPEKSVCNQELDQVLEDLINELPPAMLQTARMYFFEHLAHDTIAEKMRCPPGTVRSRIFRIRQFLIRNLKKYWD